jgi:phage terminase large subunit
MARKSVTDRLIANQAKERQSLDFDRDIAKFTERQMEACGSIDSGRYKYILYGGALGGGKSYWLRWVLVRLLMAWFFEKGLTWVAVMLACEDYPSLKDRQMQKIAREFPPWLGKGYSDHKDYGRCFILGAEYGNGVICFRNLDDASKYQSSEFAAAAIDEFTKNDYDTFTEVRKRLRWPGLSDDECLLLAGTNPGGIGHGFTKALWIDKIYPEEFKSPVDYSKKFCYIPAKAEDNPFLDASYWTMLNTLPVHQRAAFRDGSWDTFIGQAFQEWSRVHHVIKKMPVPEGAPLFMTFDWGFGAPFYVGWYWLDSDGRFYLFNEWYGWNGTPNKGLRLSDSEIAEGVIKREESMGFGVRENKGNRNVVNPQIIRFCDPTCFNKKPNYMGGGQGMSTAEEFALRGLILRPGDPSRALKWRQVHQRLMVPRGEDGNVNGVPMLQVYENCIHFIRTLPNLVVNPNNDEDIDGDEDHAADSFALLCMARPMALSRFYAEQKKVDTMKRQPKDVSEVAFLELQAFRNQVEMNDMMSQNYYGGW